MTDQATTTATTDQPAIVNGFNHLTTSPTAEPPAAAAAPPAAPPLQPTATPAPPPADERTPTPANDPTPYRLDPHLLPEHALLGSLLHAPKPLDDLEQFLGVRDFSTPQTRAVYATLRGLHRTGALFDVAALPTEAERLQAANENHLRLLQTLRTTPSPFTTITVDNVPKLLAQLTTAAPPQTLPFRGIYDPRAQLHLGRMVLEDSCRRQLRAMGVLMRRTKPLTGPAAPSTTRAERATQTLVTNLRHAQAQVDDLTQRLLTAITRSSPTGAPGRHRATPPAPPTAMRSRLPDQLRTISAPLQQRAERHLLHLALHAGRSDLIPSSILDLRPEDFTNTRHANLWRTILDLRARQLPVNYVSVIHATRTHGFPHLPMPSPRTLIRMAQPPEIKPSRIARSLRTLLTTALTRATSTTQHELNVLAADASTPVTTLLDQAKTNLNHLAHRAGTAAHQHHQATAHTRPHHR